MKFKNIIFIFFLLAAIPLNAEERSENYDIQKIEVTNTAVSIDSETVTFNNRRTSAELVLSNTLSGDIETEIQLKIKPVCKGVSFTEGALPVEFSVLTDKKDCDFSVKYKEKLYSKAEAEKIQCQEESTICIKLNFCGNEKKKLVISYKNDFQKSGDGEYLVSYVFSAEKNKKVRLCFTEENMTVENFYTAEMEERNSRFADLKVIDNVRRINDGNVFYEMEIPDSLTIIRYDVSWLYIGLILSKNPGQKNYGSVYLNSSVLDKNCSEARLKEADLFYLKKEDLRFLRNAFYACRGYIFKNKELLNTFSEIYKNQQSEYPLNPDFSESDFTEVEKYNIDLIKKMENTKDTMLLLNCSK